MSKYAVFFTLKAEAIARARLSRSPWNFGGGPWVIRRHPPWRV